MKRFSILFLILFLFSCYTFSNQDAAASNNQKARDKIQSILDAVNDAKRYQSENLAQIETPLIDLFIDCGVCIENISFDNVDDYLKNTKFEYERILPTSEDLGSHSIYDDNGFVLYMGYMPIDSSYDSKDFGNTAKEMLYCVQLSCGDRSISMSNNMHTTEIICSTYDKSSNTPHKQVSSLESLLNFFQDAMGGAVPDELWNVALPTSSSSQIKRTIQHRSEEYSGSETYEIKINIENGSNPTKYIIAVYFEWKMNVNLDKVTELITIYSDDLAAYIANKHDDVSEVYAFWKVPKFYDDTIAAKNGYILTNGHAYIDTRYGLIYK